MSEAKQNKNNLITLLKTFSKAEIKELLKFAKSPFFNKRKDVIKYITLLVKSHPDFKIDVMAKEKLHSLIYPGKKFEDINIRRLNSHSLNLVEDYLYYSHGKNDFFEKNNYIILEYMKRDSIRLAASKVEKSLNELRMDTLELNEYFTRRSKLNNYKSLLERLTRKDRKFGYFLARSCSDNIASALIDLSSSYYTLTIERTSVKFDLERSAVNTYFNELNIDLLLKNLKESGEENYPFLRLCYLQVKCINNTQDDSLYEEYLSLLTELESKLSHDSLVSLHGFRYDYLHKKKREMAPHYKYLGVYELIKELCTKDLLKYSNEPFIVSGHGLILAAGDVAGSEGDLDFLKYLREHIVKQVHPDVRYITDQFLKLHECYIQQNYEECVKILNTTNVDHAFFYSRFKILEVQIFFDMGEYEHVFSLIDAFKHFYNKRFVEPQFHEMVMRYLNILAKLCNLSMSYSKTEALVLEKAIKNVDAKIIQRWLEPRFKSILEKHKKTL